MGLSKKTAERLRAVLKILTGKRMKNRVIFEMFAENIKRLS